MARTSVLLRFAAAGGVALALGCSVLIDASDLVGGAPAAVSSEGGAGAVNASEAAVQAAAARERLRSAQVVRAMAVQVRALLGATLQGSLALPEVLEALAELPVLRVSPEPQGHRARE